MKQIHFRLFKRQYLIFNANNTKFIHNARLIGYKLTILGNFVFGVAAIKN